jgi:hypothetical protein
MIIHINPNLNQYIKLILLKATTSDSFNTYVFNNIRLIAKFLSEKLPF